MGRLLASIFGLRRGERGMALLMAVYHFLLLITLYLLKPVRDSLFLSERGAQELPFVFILTTLAVLPVALLHTRMGRRLHVGRLIDGVSLFLVVNLVGLRWLIGIESETSAYVLYAWVSIYGLLITSQFWLLANAIFSASQAKRVFTALSVGAILGAVAGGEITGLLVDELGMRSANLLWVTAAVLLGAILLGRYIRYRYRHEFGSLEDRSPERARWSEDGPSAPQIIAQSRHLQFIVGVIALTVITTTFVDFKFKTVAAAAYVTEEELTTFMGRFYGRVSLVALLVQFVVAPRVMRIVGIGGALSVLPAALAMGTVGMIALPGLAAGVLLRGADQSLKHSIDKTGRELLFVPVSLQKKKRVKVFLDLFVDQGAQGIGGALLLLLAVGFGFDVQALSLITLGLIGLWAVLAYRARDSYVDQFRSKLRRQQAETRTGSVDDAEPRGDGAFGQTAETEIEADLDELLTSLCSRTETDTLRALNELESSDTTVPVDALLCLFDHPAAAVREHAIRVFRARRVENVGRDVAEMLTDPDADVQLEAARYLYCKAGNRMERLMQGLTHDDLRIQAAAVGLIAEEGGDPEYRLVTEPLLRRLIDERSDVGADARIHVARILGVLDRPFRNDLLMTLLDDDHASVVRAAIHAAGKTKDRRFVYPLLRRLGDDAFEQSARRALRDYGRRITGTLHDHIVDPAVDLSIRRRIPPILAGQPCQLSVTVLVRSLNRVPVPVRHAVVRALSKLHVSGSYTFNSTAIEDAIYTEAEHYAALGQILHLRLRTRAASNGHVDPTALHDLRHESLERIFRLLALQHDQRDIYDAYLGVTSDDASLRASAVEFVDNLVEYGTSKYVVPLLDDADGRQAVDAGRRLFQLQIRSWDRAVEYLNAADDPRLVEIPHSQAPLDIETDRTVTYDGTAPTDGADAETSVGDRDGASRRPVAG